MQRKAFTAATSELGPRSVRVTCSTNVEDRAGEIVEQNGIDLSSFNANPIILFSHNPEHPVGRATAVDVVEGKLQADIEFAPEGISQKADEVCALVKQGIIKTVSIGFDPVDMEPMNPARPRGPQHYLKIELLEISFVAIPANPEAIVTDKSFKAKKDSEWKVGASRDLPIEDSDDWDGPAAEDSIFEHAGGDDFKPAEAKLGFLVYDSANPNLKGSYKLPIAHVVDGELKVPKGAIRAAASRLPQTDIPDGVKKSAQAVIDAYKKKAGIGDEDDKSKSKPARRVKAMIIKGLYGVGRLAYLLECLGYEQESAKIEAALEGDESKLPAMLAAAMQQVGAALIAMTEEEVSELLSGTEEDDDEDSLDAEDTVIVMAAKNPAHRKYLVGRCKASAAMKRTKAGRKISAATADDLKAALDHHEKGIAAGRDAIRAHTKCADVIKSLLPEEGDEDQDEDTQDTQSTGQDADSEGEKSASYRRRQADLLALSRPAGRA